MALLPIYNYFIFNGKITPVSEFVPSENEGGIYEVLRIVKGVPLFLEDHLQRFYHSAEISGKTITYSVVEIRSFLHNLIEKNKVDNGNVLVSCKTNLKAFFIPHRYPTSEEYNKGVSCGVLHAERINPNAKVFQTEVRRKANELIEQNSIYEVLLVDRDNTIREGSRTNVFFIKNETIVTPKAEKVLLGITRQKTILCAKQLGFTVQEREVAIGMLSDYDAVFLTGTSPKILPVNSVEGLAFNPGNSVLKELIHQFNLSINEYIKNARY